MTRKKKVKTPDLVFRGGGFLPGIPARDLTGAEVEDRGLDIQVLIDCGLYRPAANEEVALEDKKEGE